MPTHEDIKVSQSEIRLQEKLNKSGKLNEALVKTVFVLSLVILAFVVEHILVAKFAGREVAFTLTNKKDVQVKMTTLAKANELIASKSAEIKREITEIERTEPGKLFNQ